MEVTKKVLLVVVVVATLLACGINGAEDRRKNINQLVDYADSFNWTAVEAVLNDAIANEAFPGCVAIVGNVDGYLFAKAFGNFTYGVPPPETPDYVPPMTLDTLFDLASLTKVTGANNAIAQFYQRGELALDTPITKILGPEFAVNGKEDITVLNCLLHNAGYPADPSPGYWEAVFGCPGSAEFHPPEDFSCQDQIYAAFLNQTLQNPVGSVYLYSDLSFITLSFVVGNLAQNLGYVSSSDLLPGCDRGGPGAVQCYFEAYVRKYIFEALNLTNTTFLPPQAWWPNAAPTNNDTGYRNVVVQGQVEDPNSYAMGGIAGHAGIFSTVHDIFTINYNIMFAPESSEIFLNSTTAHLWTKEYNHSQSSRALGWNTNDPTVYDYGWNLTCGDLSNTTWMHLGYTGTEICGDPVREIITLLFTNRVYPSVDNEPKIMSARQEFNTAVRAAYDEGIASLREKREREENRNRDSHPLQIN